MSTFITGREPHPTMPLASDELRVFMGKEWAERYDKVRATGIAQMENDPLRYGYEPPSWKRADTAIAEFRKKHPVGVIIALILGGHRAGKTEWRAKRTVQNLFAKPSYKVWACQATQEASREAQQSKIYKYLPTEYKTDTGKLRHGSKLKVNYAPWSGFTEDVFAVQSNDGSTSDCRFKFYSMNARSLEGAEINEGWADEEATLEWLDALIFRLVSRNGILYLTFTPRWGYTPPVKALLNGAVTIEETEGDMELLAVRDERGEVIGAKKVPLIQENPNVQVLKTKSKSTIVYFHTSENPFPYQVDESSGNLITNWDSMKETLLGSNEDKILTTAYGVPTRSISSQFNYKDTVHRMILAVYMALKDRLGNKGPRYQLVDPCPGRNWFMMWIWFWAPKFAVIYREWPSYGHPGAFIEGIGDPGPWAIAGNAPDGERGDAQRPFMFGYERYVEEIAKAEGWWHGDLKESLAKRDGGERITRRLVDGRYAVSPTQMREGSTTWIQEMDKIGLDYIAMVGEKKILSGENDGSIEMINHALSYDPKIDIGQFSPRLARINEPYLMVLETCPNTINSLETWTGRDGQHGACKDPIDTIRGCYLSELDYMDETYLQPQTPWLAQFGR